MFPLKNTEAYIHANGFRSTLGKELSDRDAAINELGSEIQALTNKLTDEAETRAALGAHNLLPYDLASLKAINTAGTWSGNAYTVDGATFTLNNDGTISVSKPSASTGPNTMQLKIDWYLPVGSYKINGNPSGGGSETRRITLEISNGSTKRYASDIGSGNEFTLASGEYISQLNIRLGASTTYTGTISPMIRLATDSDTTYQPYAKTNLELTADVATSPITLTKTENITVLNYSAIKIGKLVFISGYFEGTIQGTGDETATGIIATLSDVPKSFVYGNGTLQQQADNAVFPAAFGLSTSGNIYQTFSSLNIYKRGNFNFIYSV